MEKEESTIDLWSLVIQRHLGFLILKPQMAGFHAAFKVYWKARDFIIFLIACSIFFPLVMSTVKRTITHCGGQCWVLFSYVWLFSQSRYPYQLWSCNWALIWLICHSIISKTHDLFFVFLSLISYCYLRPIMFNNAGENTWNV